MLRLQKVCVAAPARGWLLWIGACSPPRGARAGVWKQRLRVPLVCHGAFPSTLRGAGAALDDSTTPQDLAKTIAEALQAYQEQAPGAAAGASGGPPSKGSGRRGSNRSESGSREFRSRELFCFLIVTRHHQVRFA